MKQKVSPTAKLAMWTLACVVAGLLVFGDRAPELPLQSHSPQEPSSESAPGTSSIGPEPAAPRATPEELPEDAFTISFDVLRVTPRGNGYAVQLNVQNLGTEAVANLHIEGQLYSGSERLERSIGQLAAVPSRAERQVSLYFTRDPRQHELRLLAKDLHNPQSEVSQTASLYIGSYTTGFFQ